MSSDEYLPISIRFEGAWKYSLSFGFGRENCFTNFEHEYHEGEYVLFPGDNFREEFANSPAGLCLAKSVRFFVKAKLNPTMIDGRLMRVQMLCTPKNAVGATDPRVYDMTYLDSEGYYHGFDFFIDSSASLSSFYGDIGEWQVEYSEDSFSIEVKDLMDKDLEPSLLAILYMHKAKHYLNLL